MKYKASKIVKRGMALEIMKKWIPPHTTVLDVGNHGKTVKTDEYQIITSDKDSGDYPIDLNKPYELFEATYGSEPQFGAITAWQVIEHLENPYEALRTVKKLLRPDGIFIFSIPNTFLLKNRLLFLLKGEMTRYNDGNDHKVIFTHTTLRHFLADWKVLHREEYKTCLYYVCKRV